MKRYETLFIVQSELSSDDITAIIDRYSKIITDMKGTVLKVERWGKRKLAYLIRKQSRGFYILIDFAGKREIVAEVERILKFDDKVLKYMSVKLVDSITAEEIEKVLAGQKAAAEAAAEPPAVIKPASAAAAAAPAPEATTEG
ncbi:MAG: 30S ribosomal protein S6 [Syntrophales bacterium]|nr:30S ribosomal protein S6 [Syntrophales bacterium]